MNGMIKIINSKRLFMNSLTLLRLV